MVQSHPLYPPLPSLTTMNEGQMATGVDDEHMSSKITRKEIESY